MKGSIANLEQYCSNNSRLI